MLFVANRQSAIPLMAHFSLMARLPIYSIISLLCRSLALIMCFTNQYRICTFTMCLSLYSAMPVHLCHICALMAYLYHICPLIPHLCAYGVSIHYAVSICLCRFCSFMPCLPALSRIAVALCFNFVIKLLCALCLIHGGIGFAVIPRASVYI